MFYRKCINELIEWKSQPQKKALCILGARQIGKTTLVREFAKKYYTDFVEINFFTDSSAQEIFSSSLEAQTLITNITAYAQKQLTPKKTLIFFDEIQECPTARTAIKFLVEDGRFDYIESGSQLGVNYKNVPSYPVGFEEIHYMYPMSFMEFAMANGVQKETFDYLQNCFQNKSELTESVHNTMIKLFYSFIVVGGMPAVVSQFVKTHDIGKVIEEQKSILELYRLDIAKYAQGNDKIKIKAIFDSIPSQLDDKNRRFMLSKLDENARQNRYENSFEWLSEAGVALPCFNVIEPQPSLRLNEKRNLFKLFMGDTGLLCAACMENVQFDLLQGRLDINMGSILENIIAQELKANGFILNYFDSKKYGEIDFVLQNGMKTDLIEVKSGNNYKKHNALNSVLKVSDWKFNNTIVFCKDNIQKEERILYLPWYMIIFYQPEQIPTGMKFEVDLTGL